jgi:PAP2 superfamily
VLLFCIWKLKKETDMKQNNKAGGIQPAEQTKNLLYHISMQLFILLTTVMLSSFTSCKRLNNDVNIKNPVNPFPTITNRVILDWNLLAFETMGGTSYQNTLVASRLNAMVHIAMHDALNAIAPVYTKYNSVTNDTGAHPVAAAAAAAHTVLVNQFPEKKTMLDEQLAKALDTIANAAAKQKGIALGIQSGNAILEIRKNDGANQNPIAPVAPSTTPGVYQAVPPFDFVFAPFWVNMQTFGLQKPDQFRSQPMPSLSSNEYQKDFNEVKAYGEKNSTVRSAEQSFYAKFWYEFSEIGWNRITRVVAGKEQTDLLSTARLFALLNIALADSYTAGWDSKFYYNFWRPYTAIHFNNENTWEPLMPTPPVQDYPSTHSVLGNAGATVLTYFYGNNYAFAFKSTSSPSPEEERSFKSFLKAADENADSRVMAGIHFRFATKAGQEMGNKIGKYALENKLKPIK